MRSQGTMRRSWDTESGHGHGTGVEEPEASPQKSWKSHQGCALGPGGRGSCGYSQDYVRDGTGVIILTGPTERGTGGDSPPGLSLSSTTEHPATLSRQRDR